MRAHVIKNGKVVNTIEVQSLKDRPDIVDAKSGGIGWLYDGEKFTKPDPVPVEKTKQELAKEELGTVKAGQQGKPLSMAYLDKRLDAIEKYLNIDEV